MSSDGDNDAPQGVVIWGEGALDEDSSSAGEEPGGYQRMPLLDHEDSDASEGSESELGSFGVSAADLAATESVIGAQLSAMEADYAATLEAGQRAEARREAELAAQGAHGAHGAHGAQAEAASGQEGHKSEDSAAGYAELEEEGEVTGGEFRRSQFDKACAEAEDEFADFVGADTPTQNPEWDFAQLDREPQEAPAPVREYSEDERELIRRAMQNVGPVQPSSSFLASLSDEQIAAMLASSRS